MHSFSTWQEYNHEATIAVNKPRVPEFFHHIFLTGGLHPGLIPWDDRFVKSPVLLSTVRTLENIFSRSYIGLNISVEGLESPLAKSGIIPSPNPDNICEIYGATLSAINNGLLCAGITIDLCYNKRHKRESDRLQEYPQELFRISALLPLVGYQEMTKSFLSEAWNNITCLDYCRKHGKNFDQTFFLEVLDGTPVSGGKNLLTKLGLTLPEKPVYLPC